MFILLPRSCKNEFLTLCTTISKPKCDIWALAFLVGSPVLIDPYVHSCCGSLIILTRIFGDASPWLYVQCQLRLADASKANLCIGVNERRLPSAEFEALISLSSSHTYICSFFQLCRVAMNLDIELLCNQVWKWPNLQKPTKAFPKCSSAKAVVSIQIPISCM